MAATPIRRHAPGASAGPDLRSPSQASHLALVQALEAECPARTPQQAFCARLRSVRERRGISVKAVAESTKVTTSVFEALERGDIARWPKGIYKRSFFRSYVAAIGLPTDSTVEEFLRLFPDDKRPDRKTDAPPAPFEPEAPASPLRLTLAPEPWRLSLHRRVTRPAAIDALVILVAALVLVWWSDVDVRTGALIVGLCYYPQLARLVRHSANRPTPHAANVLPADAHEHADGHEHEAAHVTATVTS